MPLILLYIQYSLNAPLILLYIQYSLNALMPLILLYIQYSLKWHQVGFSLLNDKK